MVESYEQAHQKLPPLPLIVNYVHRFKTEVDKEFLRKYKDSNRVYNMAEIETAPAVLSKRRYFVQNVRKKDMKLTPV